MRRKSAGDGGTKYRYKKDFRDWKESGIDGGVERMRRFMQLEGAGSGTGISTVGTQDLQEKSGKGYNHKGH
jgi:hypothetical protein